MNKLNITIVIPSYNGIEHLKILLPTLESIHYPKDLYEVIVVDDYSKDGTFDYLNKEWSHLVKPLRNDKNLGFAGTCNHGAREAHGEWVVFLNNDTKVDPEYLNGFCKVICPEKKIVCGAGKILSWDGQHIDFVKGSMNAAGKGFNKFSGKPYKTEEHQTSYQLLFACGGSMIIKREIFLEIGGFDEDYFIIFEDVDIGWRLALYGYKTYFCPESITYHKLHSYLNTINLDRKVFLHERNSFMTIFKNFDPENFDRIIPKALMLMGNIAEQNCHFSKHPMPADYYTMPPVKQSLLDRIRGKLQQWLHPHFEYFTEISKTGYGQLKVYGYLLENYSKLEKKRAYIQSQRVMTDEEILPLLEDHTDLWRYSQQYQGFLSDQSFEEKMKKLYNGKE